jgi:RNA-dependent RNA polymerase
MAVAEARMVDDSIAQFIKVLGNHHLGTGYRLIHLLRRLSDLGLDLNDHNHTTVIRDSFHARLRRAAMNHILRDIKHHARISIPRSYQLVGIADEGLSYKAAGYKDVFALEQGQIYGQCNSAFLYLKKLTNKLACIQRPGDDEPTWLSGNCLISRNPVVHPGDGEASNSM